MNILVVLAGNKVSKEDGKGLSSNDFTDELATKLNVIYDKAALDVKFSDINTRIDSIKGSIVCVASNEEQDALLTTDTKYAGMVVYVAGTPAIPGEGNTPGIEATVGTYWSLNDDLTTWAPFGCSLSQEDMQTVFTYVQSSIEQSKYEELEDGTAYLTLL